MDFTAERTEDGLYRDKHGAIWNTAETAMLWYVVHVLGIQKSWSIDYNQFLSVAGDRDAALIDLAVCVKKEFEAQIWRSVTAGELRKYPESLTDLVSGLVKEWGRVDFMQIAAALATH